MNKDRVEALLLEALDYDMAPLAKGLIQDALDALATKAYPLDAKIEEGPKGLKYLDFTDPVSGVPWRMVVVRQGDLYGTNKGAGRPFLSNDATMIEFWDRRYDHDAEHRAQFVSRYYLTTITNCRDSLLLDGGVPDWHLCKESMQLCRRVLARCEVT